MTGAISLTPLWFVNGALQPTAEVLTYTNFSTFIAPRGLETDPAGVYSGRFCDDGLRSDCGILDRSVPREIKYTSLSLPYHIGNGVFGGLLPLIGLSVIAQTGNIYAGLYYPIAVASITFIVGSLLLKETRHITIWNESERTERQS